MNSYVIKCQAIKSALDMDMYLQESVSGRPIWTVEISEAMIVTWDEAKELAAATAPANDDYCHPEIVTVNVNIEEA